VRHANRVGVLLLIPALALILGDPGPAGGCRRCSSASPATPPASCRRSTSPAWRTTSGCSTPRFLTAIKNTLVFTAVTVPLELVLGIVLALLLNRQLPGRWLVRMAILLPWALPTALTALMWRWMFNGEYGLFNALLQGSGLIEGASTGSAASRSPWPA
jgi:ABC-type sugar transport system permease subunit